MIALLGNPNTGKSTLFNAITQGRRAHVSNLVGTTVQAMSGPLSLGERTVTCVDIPGTFSLAGRSPEEWHAIRAVLGIGSEKPECVLLMADAVRLERSLYLALQVLELGIPMVVAVNLIDEAERQGLKVEIEALAADLRVPVVGISARSQTGLDALKEQLVAVLDDPSLGTPGPAHEWSKGVLSLLNRVHEELPPSLSKYGTAMAGLVLLSLDDPEARPDAELNTEAIRALLPSDCDAVSEMVTTRYRWLDERSSKWRAGTAPAEVTFSDRVDKVLLHPVSGGLLFLLVMFAVFTMLFSGADPMIGFIEGAFGNIGDLVSASFGEAPSPGVKIFRDFIVDGLIGGVGSVLVFVPQIALLYFFIGLMEDSGYLARAAHLVDRLLRLAGLPGKAFVPLLSGYACAVPAIMATRTMPRFRDRLLTMLVLPFTSCSARLPIYSLIIAALFPASVAGVPFGVRPLALLAMYLFSAVVTLAASVVLGRLLLPASTDSAFIELVPYRLPSLSVVLRSTYRNAKQFVHDAGRVILVATLFLWALLYFPRYSEEELLTDEVVAEAAAAGVAPDGFARALALERSYGGQLGHAIEPVIKPLGFDWQMGIGIVGSFAAREVFVSTMGLVYGIQDDDDDASALREKIAKQVRPDGTKVWTPLVGFSLMIFFALAMQCTSTLAVLTKETASYRWPAFVFTYMTALAWLGSFLVFQVGRLLGFG